MEKSYAFAAKQVALFAGLLCFILFLFMVYPIIRTSNIDETPIVCGNTLLPTFGGEAKKCKMLFITNCAQCHAKNMKDPLTGPPLGGWQQYFKNEKEVLTYLNNPKNYKTKNKALKKLLKEYEPTECTPFPAFKEEDVAALVKYIDAVYR